MEGFLTLTLDQVILHTVVHHSSTATYTPNFIKIEETFCGMIKVHTYVCMDGHLRPTLLGRLRRVDLKICSINGGRKPRGTRKMVESLKKINPMTNNPSICNNATKQATLAVKLHL